MQQIKELIKQYYGKNFINTEFKPGKSMIPASGKVFDEQELIMMTEAVLKGWWTDGEYAQKFEKALADYIGVRFVSLVNSGSSANLVAFATLTSHLLKDRRIQEGDEVITVAAGFPTTLNPIILYKCIPVFVDIDLETCEIDTSKLEEALSKKTKAVFIAHTLGNTFDARTIKKFCEKHNLWLIEDNCDALGAEYENKKTGTFGDISTVSFYPAHHITTAEGGAVVTNDILLNKIIRSIRDWGRDCWCPTGKDNTCKQRFNWKLGHLPRGYDHKYIYSHIGYNLKMTDIQAACGLAQIKKLDQFVEKRRENYALAKEKLEKFKDIFSFVRPTLHSNPSWFGFIMTIKEKARFTRRELLKFLDDRKIGTRLVFAGNIIKQPYFIDNKIPYRIVENLKNTDVIMNNTFWIGVYPALEEKHYNYIRDCIGEFLKLTRYHAD